MERCSTKNEKFKENNCILNSSYYPCESIIWLKENGLLIDTLFVFCHACESEVNEIKGSSNIDGRRFMCINNTCRVKILFRIKSNFFNSRQPLKIIVKLFSMIS